MQTQTSGEPGAAEPDLLVSLVFSNLNVSLLHHVRSFVSSFLASHPGKISAQRDSEVALTLHELLENAVRYADDKKSILEVRTDLLGEVHVLLRTTNRANARNAARVLALIERLSTTPAAALYQQLLEETIKHTEGSGLGLVRIAAECGMTVRGSYDGEHLKVEASSRAPAQDPTPRSSRPSALPSEIP